MSRTRRAGMITLFVAVALAAVLVVGVTSALAAAPDVVGSGDADPNYFLCPSVGQGVANHLGLDPDDPPLPGDRFTFLPGHNQAGLHVNENGTNGNGGPGTPAPGNGNSNWSPIWNGEI